MYQNNYQKRPDFHQKRQWYPRQTSEDDILDVMEGLMTTCNETCNVWNTPCVEGCGIRKMILNYLNDLKELEDRRYNYNRQNYAKRY